MKAIIIVMGFAAILLPQLCMSQNLVPNGGFEDDFSGWTPVDSVSISTNIVYSGMQSMMASDTAKTLYSYAYQELNLDYDTHEINFGSIPRAPHI